MALIRCGDGVNVFTPSDMTEITHMGGQVSTVNFTANIPSGQWFILVQWATQERAITDISGFSVLEDVTLTGTGYDLVHARLCVATSSTQSATTAYCSLSVLEIS